MKKIVFPSLFVSLFVALVLLTMPVGVVMAAETKLGVVADTFISQNHPDDTHGNDQFAAINNDPSAYNCYLARFEDATLPPEVILDKAELQFHVNVNLHGQDAILQIGVNDPSVSVYLHEDDISWDNSPVRLTDYAYTVYKHVNIEAGGDRVVDITKLYEAWQTGTVHNNGLYICVAPSQPHSSFIINTKESADPDVKPSIILTYHTATLGEPPREEDSPAVEFSFHLLDPDGATLTTPPYIFTWQSAHAPDPDRQHLKIIVNKRGSGPTMTEVFSHEIPANWTRYESSIDLEDGSYEWFIQAYDTDTPVYETEHKEFTVDHSTATDTEAGGSSDSSPDVGEHATGGSTSENSSGTGANREQVDETRDDIADTDRSPLFVGLAVGLGTAFIAAVAVMSYILLTGRMHDQVNTVPKTKAVKKVRTRNGNN